MEAEKIQKEDHTQLKDMSMSSRFSTNAPKCSRREARIQRLRDDVERPKCSCRCCKLRLRNQSAEGPRLSFSGSSAPCSLELPIPGAPNGFWPTPKQLVRRMDTGERAAAPTATASSTCCCGHAGPCQATVYVPSCESHIQSSS